MNFEWLWDPEFWSILIAISALVLSQLPPIKELIKGKELRMAVADTVSMYHTYGMSSMNLWIDLENIGGKVITIRKIKCFLIPQRGHTQTLKAKTYWITESFSSDKPIELPLSEIALGVGDRWSGLLHLWDTESLTPTIQSRIKSVKKRLTDDLNAKIASRDREHAAVAISERPLVEAEHDIVVEIKQIVKELRKLEIGSYELLVAVYENDDKIPLKLLGFDLTLFDLDISEIFHDVEEYKYGFGVILPLRVEKVVQVEVRGKNEIDSQRLFKEKVTGSS